jgi:hypothetical protein
MCADPDWPQRVEDELMATISLAIPEQLRGKIEMDDVRQGGFLRFHWTPDSREGRPAGEKRAYPREAMASELAYAIRRYATKGRRRARERPLEAAIDDCDLSCFRCVSPVTEGTQCLGEADGGRGVHDGA